MWRVLIKRRMERKIAGLPLPIRQRFAALRRDLENAGPEQTSWSNYSKLSETRHHCHLTYHYVACWQVLSNNEMIMEVYYVGSRENAPY